MNNKSTPEHFWARVDKSAGSDACWPWTAARFPRGYGCVSWHGPTRRSHRIAWLLTYGPIPEGMLVCHRCDNPPCCNPAHLFLGTALDNNRDTFSKGRHSLSMAAIQRAKTHCKQGHEYTEANTYWRTRGAGRDCRECIRAAGRRWYHRNEAAALRR